MKFQIKWIGTLTLLALFFVVGWSAKKQTQERTQIQWEYQVVHTDDNQSIAPFNKLGNEGWELVSVDGGWGFFKRQKR